MEVAYNIGPEYYNFGFVCYCFLLVLPQHFCIDCPGGVPPVVFVSMT